MQQLTLGYTFPAGALGDRISNMRIAVSANNLFTISGYDGLDPGVGGAADTNFGVDVGNYPVTRAYNLSVNLDF
jgi:hypothetical protein